MKYFLTGATGFLGGVLARQLREAGYVVNAVIRDPRKATELQSLGVNYNPRPLSEGLETTLRHEVSLLGME